MSILDIKDFSKGVNAGQKEPDGHIIPITSRQEAKNVILCCGSCFFTWPETVAISMLERPQWLEEYQCKSTECGATGQVVIEEKTR